MFTGTLLPKQIPAAEKLANKKKMLLAWEQGTGKTVIALAAAEALLDTQKVKSILILAQPGNAWQWGDRIDEFTTTPYTLTTARDTENRTYSQRTPYTIVPWTLFRRDYKDISKKKWDIVIADEAQEFRNVKSKTSQYLKRYNTTKRAPDYRWALTGTAISNKLEELYNIMYWVDKQLLGDWFVFEKNHVVRNAFGTIERYKNLNGLHDLLKRTRLDRKTHADFAGQMPRLVSLVETVPWRAEYKRAEGKLLDALDKFASSVHFDQEGNPTMDSPSEVRKAFAACQKELWTPERKDAAIKRIRGILDENPINKVVVFSRLKQPLYDLHKSGISNLLFTGDQSSEQKQAAITNFSGKDRQDTSRVLLASNAGRAGLDLPFANYVINLDVPQSHEVDDQRTKRVTRLSSSFSHCVVIYLLMEDSIDLFYYEQTKAKGRLAKAVKEGGEDDVIIREESLRTHIRRLH